MASALHFGPEWMRSKQPTQARSQNAPSPPPAAVQTGGTSYSSILNPTPPPPPTENRDSAHPFKYSKEEIIQVWKHGGGRNGLGLEVERWEGVVREVAGEPICLRDLGEVEKKLFATSINSELRRRQSHDVLPSLASPLERPKLPHSTSSQMSPMRERFGSFSGRKRKEDGSDVGPPVVPRKHSLSIASPIGGPQSPREGSFNSPRTRLGGPNGPSDNALNGIEQWGLKRRNSDASSKPLNVTNPRPAVTDQEATDKHQLNTFIEEERELATEPVQDASEPGAPDPANQVHSSMQSLSLDPRPANTQSQLTSPSAVGPPPGLGEDLSQVQWSYIDPSNNVQGPFSADLMQSWHDQHYFTPDLLMKRTYLDQEWTPLGQLSLRATGPKLFLSHFVSPPPPGFPMALSDNAGPFISALGNNNQPDTSNHMQNYPTTLPYQNSINYNARNLGGNYLNISDRSDSPASSFGIGFGQGVAASPDLSYVSRTSGNGFDAIGSRFPGTRIESPIAYGQHSLGIATSSPHLQYTQRAGSLLQDSPASARYDQQQYDYNGQPTTSPWPDHTPSMTDLTSKTNNDHIGSFSQGTNGNHVVSNGLNGSQGFVQEPFGSSPSTSLSGSSFGAIGNNVRDVRSLPEELPIQQSSQENLNPPLSERQTNGTSQVSESVSLPPAQPSSSPWVSSEVSRLQQQFEQPLASLAASRPEVPKAQSPASTSAPIWPLTASSRKPVKEAASPWVAATRGVDESAWASIPGEPDAKSSSVESQSKVVPDQSADNAPSYSAPSVVDKRNKAETPQRGPEVASVAPPSKPTLPSVDVSGLKRPTVNQATLSPAVTSVLEQSPEPSSATSTKAKPAWSALSEAASKRPKEPSTLREIQEAEAKKVEARKAAEREKERALRAAQTSQPEETFSASWGLPTSQAGAARGAAKEKESPVAPATPGTPVVGWTNAIKAQSGKKTMKEIQEEEERQKKAAKEKETVAATAKRAYAESATKIVPSAAASGGVWSTVGPAGKPTPIPSPAVRQPPPSTLTTSTSVPSARPASNGPSTTVRSTSATVVRQSATPKAQDDTPVLPSASFLAWLKDALKGLSTGVNVDEFIQMLLSFPIDPSPATVELIQEQAYANSTTLDGRRFAADFIARRKADAAAVRGKTPGQGQSSGSKHTSLADVVKTQPKPVQSEWAYKVVTGKKNNRKGSKAT